MQRYLVWLRLDGTYFHGMAKTGTTRSRGVLDILQPSLRHVLEKRGFGHVRTSVPSRTDAGVHIVRAPFLLNTTAAPYLLDENPQLKAEILNEISTILGCLPACPVEFLDFHRVAAGFHARYNCAYRRYVYRLRVANNMDSYLACRDTGSVHTVLEWDHAYTLPPTFNIEKAEEFCSIFHGKTHNVATFFKDPESKRGVTQYQPNTIKTFDLMRIVPGETRLPFPDPDFTYYNVEIVSRSFLRNQIRRMIAVLANYSTGYLPRRIVDDLLKSAEPRSFHRSGFLPSPPGGLYLADVVYNPDYFVNPKPSFEHLYDQLPVSDVVEEDCDEELDERKVAVRLN